MGDWKKELRDQLLHFVAGSGGVLALTLLLPVWISSLLVASIAYGREVYQRVSKGDTWYQCGSGCMLDLVIWSAGIVTGVLIKIFVL